MITRTTYKTRQEWLHARNDTPVIGSSDVGTIMGLNPYMTPYQYWRVKKMETLETAAEEDNDSMIRGRFKEDAIARMFEQATGEKIVKRSEQIEVYRNDKYPSYMQAAPDREVFAAGRSTRYILECKDTKMHLPELTPETVPMLWYTQIMYQMGIMERDAAYIAAEEGGKRLVYALFDFDRSKFAYIVEYCRDWFERYILGDEIPPGGDRPGRYTGMACVGSRPAGSRCGDTGYYRVGAGAAVEGSRHAGGDHQGRRAG